MLEYGDVNFDRGLCDVFYISRDESLKVFEYTYD